VLEDLNSTNGIFVRAKRVRRRMLNDGDVVQIGQHEIMYFDERLSRTRALSGEGEDDAVPLVQDAVQDRKQQTADTDEDEDDAVAPMPIRADRK
jgi:general secretion pathway protein A